MITNSLFLDVSRKEIKSITVCQGDQNSRVWNVYFSNGGTQLDLKTITSISIYMRKPDGNFIYNPCQIDLDNNCAILTFDEQMCLVSGVGTLQMSMYTYDEINNSLEVLYTFAIKVIISESSIPISDITSSSEFNKLNQLIQKAESNYSDVINKISNSEQNAKQSEINAKQSEINAKQSEDNSDTYANISKSYAVGDTGTRTGEDTDNSKYYYEETKILKESIDNSSVSVIENTAKAKEYADNAETSKLAANISETNAKISETNAKKSETNAATSETNAKKSETNAATSETNAKESETKAKESETNAAASEQNAETSATNALTSATNAAVSETNSADNAILSRSYAKGDTNTREGEETDNAYYYMMQAKEASGISMDADFDSQSTNGLQNKVITEWKSQVDADRHSHSNKSVLDKLSENSTGDLQYDGNPISGDVPTNLATLSDLEKYLKANDSASFYFGVLNHKFGYYTTEAREESDFHEFSSAGFHVPPKDVYNVSVKASDGALTVSWNDPDDTYIEGVNISHWAGTILVMKANTPPADENDGTVVLTNTVRNQYAENGYVIDGLTNNTTYHLYFIPYNQEGDYEYSDNNRYTGMPAKVMLDDVTGISTSSADGSVTVNWTNPEQTKTQDGITATWVKTTVVVKADSQPTSASDGIVYESTDYSENSHTFTVENGKDYYVGFFIESDLGSVTHTTYDTATSLYATVTIATEEVTLYGKSITATFGETQTLTSTFSDSGTTQFKIPYMGEVVFTSSNDIDTATSKLTIEEWKTYAVEMSFLKIVTWADGTWEEIGAMLEAHYSNKINIADYWAVSDERNVDVSAMEAKYVGESHRAQTVTIVITDFEHDELTTPINGHTTAAVAVGQKNCLMSAECEAGTKYGENNTENGYMNSTNTNVGGWNCARRDWGNDVYYNALPEPLRSMIKPVNKLTSAGNKSTTINTTSDKIFLPSEIEIFGSTQYSVAGEGTQYQFYKNATANRYKMPKWNSSSVSNIHWERSPISGMTTAFCGVNASGNAARDIASGASGVAPHFNL